MRKRRWQESIAAGLRGRYRILGQRQHDLSLAMSLVSSDTSEILPLQRALGFFVSDFFANLITGVGSLYDLTGASFRVPKVAGPDLNADGWARDAQALRGDWQQVGRYLRAGMDAEPDVRQAAFGSLHG